MAKIARFDGNVLAFAVNRALSEKYVFGSSTTDSDVLTDQLTTEYLRGWGVVGASDFPPLEWFNAAMFTATQFIAYLHQMGVAEWNASQEYHTGSMVVYSGSIYKSTSDDNIGNQPDVSDWDSLLSSSELDSYIDTNVIKTREVTPLNNDWNGYLDPEHQSSFPSPNGYPGASGGGEVSYLEGDVISGKILAGTGGATVSSDSDGWIFTGAIRKEYTFTSAQLADIDVTNVPVFLKDQDGTPYYVKHNGTTINVTKPNATTLRVEIADGIFAGLGITKLWRWFNTEKVGYVVELSVVALHKILNKPITLASGSFSPGAIPFLDVSPYREIKVYIKYLVGPSNQSGVTSSSFSVDEFIGGEDLNTHAATTAGAGTETSRGMLSSITATSATWGVTETGWNTRLVKIEGHY